MANDGSVVIDIDGDSSKFQNALSKVGSVASKALKGLGVASAAAAGAVAAIGKAAVTAYADYEQLIGGVETLFKDSADTVMKYAQNAYKTAGMSANTYMETVTSFSASLLQSVGNDTAEAARIADMAITDMADNANKMGSNIQDIQNAYQGFAKQNYTMLDNLKLGYGGTKQEMERLLADAEKLSGVKYDLSNLNDVYEAIHVIQTELGITGTTAEEAASTIQGSAAMTKAAWDNLLVGLADDTQDFDALLTAFIDSITTLGENLIPRIQIVLQGIVKLISELGPRIAETLPGIVESVLPGLLSGATSIVGALVGVIPDLIDTLVSVIVDQGPALVQAGLDVILSLAEGLTSALPELASAATEIITTFITMLTDPGFLSGLVSAAADILLALNLAIIDAIPVLLESAPVIIENLASAIVEALPHLADAAVQFAITLGEMLLTTDWNALGASILQAIVDGLLSILGALLDAAAQIVSTIWDEITQTEWFQKGAEVLTKIVDGIRSILSGLSQAAAEIVNTVVDRIAQTEWFQKGSEILSKIVDGIKSFFSSLTSVAGEIVSEIWNSITNTDWLSLGSNIIQGIASGISSAIGHLVDAAKNAARSALDAAKGFLGIHSPSTVFKKEVGRQIPPGIGEGIEDAMPELNDNMRAQLRRTIDAASSAVASEVGGASRRLSGPGRTDPGGGDPRVVTNENGITVIIYYTGAGEPEDVKKIGRQIGAEASRELRRKGLPAT